MKDCVFCKIAAGQSPSYIVAQDTRTLAFLDRGPANKGHTLVIPRAHAQDIWHISDEDQAAVSAMTKHVAKLLDQRLSPDGLTVFQDNRNAGWQDVFHHHVHLIPRWVGDRIVPPWTAAHPSDEELAHVLGILT